MRTKIIIFIITSIIAIGSILYNMKGDLKFNAALEKKKQAVADKNSVIKASNEKQIEADKAKELEENKIKAKEKALDDQWQSGYDVYNLKKDKQSNPECIKIMNDIIAKDDKYYKAYTLKGIAQCYTSSGLYEEGMKNLNKALELKPDYGYGRYNKALALELYAKYGDAIIAYKSALEVEPYIWSYYGIASIYGRQGDAKNCVYYLNFAIKQEPETIKTLARDKNEHDFDNVRKSKEFIDATK